MIHYITTQGLGQPWVGNELRALTRSRVPFVLHAMRPPEHRLFVSAWARELDRETRRLYPVSAVTIAGSVVTALVVFRGRFPHALLNALFGRRESVRARLATIFHFLVACHWARGLRRDSVQRVHAQWAHSSASIGMYGAWLLDVPFSFTGHAVDLFRDRAALHDKIRRAEFIVCISTFHRDFFLEQGARPEQLVIAYCGIDPEAFTPQPRGVESDRTYRILAAGRLVEKKGFSHLIEACRLLRARGHDFECVIGGSGPLESDLRVLIRRHDLEACVRVTGAAITQEALPEFLGEGDLFCLPCVWSSDNDVDGLPQLLMEAMACAVPVVSTRLVGIPDLVIDDETGLLIEPGDSVRLADAIETLMREPARAARLADAGRQWVAEAFDIRTCLTPLIDRFRARPDSGPDTRKGRATIVPTRPLDPVSSP